LVLRPRVLTLLSSYTTLFRSQEEVIVPVLEELVNVKGTLDDPVRNVKFEGISFQHTTWLRPGTEKGYPDAQNNVLREYDPTLSIDRKSTRLNSSHVSISYAVF